MYQLNNNLSIENFWEEALEQGRFFVQQCRSCGHYLVAPVSSCILCSSSELKWVEASGNGEISATRPVNSLSGKISDPEKVFIDLEEGLQISGYVVGTETSQLEPGMNVIAHVGMLDGSLQVLFSVIEEEDDEW